MTRRLRLVLVGLAVFGLSGCVWRSAGFDSARTGSSPIERLLGLLGPNNVGQLAPAWTASTGTSANQTLAQDPVVDLDRAYVEGYGGLFAFDTGTGKLLWNAPLPTTPTSGVFHGIAVGPDRSVYWANPFGGLEKYTPAGQRLWLVGMPGYLGGFAQWNGPPTVSNGLVFLGYQAIPFPPGPGAAGFVAFDAATGAVRFLSADGDSGTPAIGIGRVFQGGPPVGNLAAYDATGTTNCPVQAPFNVPTCEPLSRYAIAGGGILTPSTLFGAVAGPGGVGSELAAVDPSGCGTDPCPTLWVGRAPDNGTGLVNRLAVDNGIVYATTSTGNLYAFLASGCGAAICAPLWTAAVGTVGLAAPSIANGVVYAAGVDDGRLYAFNANGCGAATCLPIWNSASRAHIFDAPAIAAGTVYISRDDGTLTAYRVPRP